MGDGYECPSCGDLVPWQRVEDLNTPGKTVSVCAACHDFLRPRVGPRRERHEATESYRGP